MTKSRPWRMALAMFLSLSLTLGFAQSAAAEPKAAANNVRLGVLVNSEKTGRDTLPENGGDIWVSVGSNGLDTSKTYKAAIALKDTQGKFSAEELGLSVVLDHKCNVTESSCKTTTKLPVYEEKLAGLTLKATIIIYAIDGKIVAQDNAHWVKVPENFKPIKPKEPLNPQYPSEPNPGQHDDLDELGQADQPAQPEAPAPPAADGKNQSNKGAIIGAIIGAVALIGIGIAFALSQAGKAFKIRR